MIIIYIGVLCLCTQLCSGCILILLVKLSQGVINGSLLANTKSLHWRLGRNDLTMASAHGTLSQFDLSTGDWKSYVERAKLYLTANDIASAEKQRAIFLSSCGDATYRRIKDVLSPRAPTDVPFKDICSIMTAHFQPQPSEIVQRFRFNTRTRQQHETVATYVTQLKRIAETCNFGDAAKLNEMIRDRLVCGIANEKWQQRLLAEDKLTYDKAYKLFLSLEASEKEVKDLSNNVQAPQVHQVRRPASHQRSHQRSDHRSEYKSSSKPASSRKPCHRCGGEGHTADQCRFKDAECRYCHKKGHIATVCRRKLRTSKSRPINTATDESDLPSGDDNEYVFPIDCITNSRSSKPLTVSVIMNSVPVQMEVDTGATVSLMNYSTFLATWPERTIQSI